MKHIFFYILLPIIIIINFLLTFSTNAAVLHSIISDEDALLALKDHITRDPNQILTKNWSASSPVCNWTGVTCGKRHNRITALDISSMGLIGTIAPHLGNLSFLVSLNISNNKFYGVLPVELGHMRRLKVIDLSMNTFTGEILSSIGSLNQLEYLDVNNNTFTGSIPSSISNLTRLKDFYAYQNQFSGSIPLEIFNISSLEILILALNELSGNLPTSICGNLPKLKRIELGYNKLSGPLPSQFSQCSELIGFGVSFNNFSGLIPKEFWSMKKLQRGLFYHNRLEGTIPKEISNLTSLQWLNLPENIMTGTIPKEIGNLTNLIQLDLGTNFFTGTIPEEIGNLHNLELLSVVSNGLSGLVPESIFNISTLIALGLSQNYLSGSLPTMTGLGLPNLEQFIIYQNNFTGFLPHFISNASRLSILEVHKNHFKGTIPHSLGNLRFLEFLNLGTNMFTNDPSSLEVEFLTPLTNCQYLRELQIYENPLNGILPESIGNFSIIKKFDAHSNGISGGIPVAMGNMSSLLILSLYDNHLTGSSETSIGSLQNLQALFLNGNHLSESLSCSLFGLQSLGGLFLHENMFSGPIPECIGNRSSLRYVRLDANKLNSEIPTTLWNLKFLLELNLSSNFLSGVVPVQVGNLKVLTKLDLSVNSLSGGIPETIENLQNLVYLSLSNNQFKGSIPSSIGKILSLENLNLSNNNLSGSLPITLEKLKYLKDLNVSYNNLAGLIPSGGPFVNFTGESFKFNKDLCGNQRFHVPPCPAAILSKKIWIKEPKHILVLCFSLVALFASITMVSVYLFLRRKGMIQIAEELQIKTSKDRISFYELQHATDKYNERNLLGQGSFGSVYKATLRDGRVVAIKVFNLQTEGAFKSFDIECEVLRNLRHRNLTQVISSCSNHDFKAIVLEYMSNGSLENWLHSENHFISFTERLNIMIDVASALHYLHSGYTTPVVHADLKPSNVLLDESKIAHVSDFGIAKMLEEGSITYTNTLATFGYIAPEYGSEGLVSTKCDVYSFGMMLMEVFTRKSPNDEMFSESLTLRDWVHNSMESSLVEIIDDDLLSTTKEEHLATVMDCFVMIMNVALNCSKVFARERSDIKEVLGTLNKIKLKL